MPLLTLLLFFCGPCQLVQVGCVSAEAKVLDKAKAASTASRCDPSCAGQCFAGMCLYAPTDLDSEDPTASLLGGLESTQKASALAEVRNQEPVAAASSEQVQRATAALVAVQESMAKLQANRPQPGAWPPSGSDAFQRTPVQRQAEPVRSGPQGYAEVRGRPVASLLTPANPNEAAFLTSEVSQLQSVLSRAEADEVELKAKNLALSRELSSWRSAGLRVMQRDSKAINILKDSPAGASAATSKQLLEAATRSSQLFSEDETRTAELQVSSALGRDHAPSGGHSRHEKRLHSFLQLPAAQTTGRAWQVILVGLLLASIVASVSMWFGVVSKAPKERRGRISHEGEARPRQEEAGWRKRVTPWLRTLGVVAYEIEISEVHVGSLAAYGDVEARFALGADEPLKTEVVQASDGSFLRFSQAFTFKAHKGSEPLTLSVVSLPAGQEIARLELTSTELIKLACREKRSYFRADLQPSDAQEDALARCAEARKPYAAMRIRSVSA